MDNTPLEDATGAPKSSSNGKRISLGLSAVAVLALVGGGVFAAAKLVSSSEYPYDHLSAGAVMYGQVNIDPSAGQKLAINKLAKKFPELEKGEKELYDALTSDNIAGAIMAEAAGDESEQGFDWVGDRIGVAVYPDHDSDGQPEVGLIIEAKEKADPADVKKIVDSINKDSSTKVSSMEIEGGDYIGIGTGDLKRIFGNDKTLAEDEKFVAQMEEVRGNVISLWGDMAKFKELDTRDKAPNVMPEEGSIQEFDDYENSYNDNHEYNPFGISDFTQEIDGQFTASLRVRGDGIDFVGKTYDVHMDGKALVYRGDPAKVAKELEKNSYADAVFSIGVGGLDESVTQALASTKDDSEKLDQDLQYYNITLDEVPKLLGNVMTFSIRPAASGESFDFDASVTLRGVDPKAWNSWLTLQNTSTLDVANELSSALNSKVTFTIEGDTLSLTVGTQPEGGRKYEKGNTMGDLDLDRLMKLLSSWGVEDAKSSGDFGRITFHGSNSDDGVTESVLGWTTPR